MQPPIYHHTQSRASLALPDYSRYFRVVWIVRQHQTSPVPSVSSSRHKQRWRSSLHDTRHPIILALTVLWMLFVLSRSFVLGRFSFTLRRSSLMLWQVLARASMCLARALMVLARASTVLARALMVLARASTALTRNSTGLAGDSTGLTHASTVLTRSFISRVTQDKVWSIRCCRYVYLVLVQNRD